MNLGVKKKRKLLEPKKENVVKKNKPGIKSFINIFEKSRNKK